MIYGIGIDIVEIDRINKIIIRSGDKLAKRILIKSELKIYYNNKYPARFLAKRFVGKEAAVKAFGTGINKNLSFNQFEILNDKLGKPIIRVFDNAELLSKKLLLTNMHITLADTRLYACSTVVFER